MPQQRGDAAPLPLREQLQAALADDVGGGLVLTEGEQATEAEGGAALGEVEPCRAEHRRVRLLHVDAARREATSGDLEQQRVDAEALVPCAYPHRPRRRPHRWPPG